MKIIFFYPLFAKNEGRRFLGLQWQYRIMQGFPYSYSLVTASAATLLHKAGHEVIWSDCLAENTPYEVFLEFVRKEKPDLIAIETSTPFIKAHWRVINELKKIAVDLWRLDVALFGDHVTALPEESFHNSDVDFVLTGGDYDFLLLNLCNYIYRQGVSDFKDLEPGIYYREDNQIKNTGEFHLNHDLNALPFIDRNLTKWQLYSHSEENFTKKPGTFIMSGRDCWWGKCSFCSWPKLYPRFRVRSANNVLNEIGTLIYRYRVREIADDSGSFPVGDWLKEFCNGMIKTGYDRKVRLNCSLRPGSLSGEDYKLMKKSGFASVSFGLESANQNTLDRIGKGLKVEDAINDCKLSSQAGLRAHVTVMFGYPWETFEEASETLKLASWLLRKGYAYSAKAALVMPYPGTNLFEECKKKGWLNTMDWDDYRSDMPVVKMPISDSDIMDLFKGIDKASFNPARVIKRLFSFLKYYEKEKHLHG